MIGFADKAIYEHEEVLLFPSFGQQLPDGRWRLEIAGAIYDPLDVKIQMRVLLRLLQRVMKIDPIELQNEIFQQRIEAFVGSSERGKRIHIQMGNEEFQLHRKSKRNGHFLSSLVVDESLIEELRDQGAIEGDQLRFSIDPGFGRSFEGRIHLVKSHGLSVISDIDDTIKDTNVTSRKELVANTFFREFRNIDGIAEVYQGLANEGADFHYVSSSPWQLVRPLTHFIDQDFPRGTFHLRHFRLRDQMLTKLMLRRKGKSYSIKRLLESFPQRQFILFGDSREKDPEIYAKACRKHPDQCLAIFIRSFDDRPMTRQRIDKINEVCRKDICVPFRTGDELKVLVEEQGLVSRFEDFADESSLAEQTTVN